MSKARGRSGLTLVETMVVVAVIAMLLGIMAPALRSSRGTARRVTCSSNVRQLLLANDVYAAEHAGRYAPGAARFLENVHRWHGARSATNEPFDARDGALTAYLSGEGTSTMVRECPSFSQSLEALAESGAGFERAAGGYGYNNAFVGVERARDATGRWRLIVDGGAGVRDQVGAPQHKFAQPVQSLAFADAALANDRARDGVIEYSFLEPRFWPDAPTARPDPSIHFRHVGHANAGWLDGHVSSEPLAFTYTSGLSARDAGIVDIGWFGSDDDNSLFDYD